MMYKAKPTSEFIQGRLYNCYVCVSIFIHFVLHKIITFRFAKALHFVLPDLIETKKFFCSFINLFCNASNDYYYLMNEKTIQNALPSIFLCETPFLSSTAIKQNIAFQQRRQRYEFLC
nr:MAG TPA: hypothetical protein [Caudoviricetes sp.]